MAPSCHTYFVPFLLHHRSAEARDTGGLQQVLGLLAAEGFSLPFPLDDVPQRLGDITVIEREGKVGSRGAERVETRVGCVPQRLGGITVIEREGKVGSRGAGRVETRVGCVPQRLGGITVIEQEGKAGREGGALKKGRFMHDSSHEKTPAENVPPLARAALLRQTHPRQLRCRDGTMTLSLGQAVCLLWLAARTLLPPLVRRLLHHVACPAGNPLQVLGCAAIRDLGSSPDGVKVRGCITTLQAACATAAPPAA